MVVGPCEFYGGIIFLQSCILSEILLLNFSMKSCVIFRDNSITCWNKTIKKKYLLLLILLLFSFVLEQKKIRTSWIRTLRYKTLATTRWICNAAYLKYNVRLSERKLTFLNCVPVILSVSHSSIKRGKGKQNTSILESKSVVGYFPCYCLWRRQLRFWRLPADCVLNFY